jgi:hypothetical protein
MTLAMGARAVTSLLKAEQLQSAFLTIPFDSSRGELLARTREPHTVRHNVGPADSDEDIHFENMHESWDFAFDGGGKLMWKRHCSFSCCDQAGR